MLARGEICGTPEDFGIQIRITSGDVAAIREAQVIQVVPTKQGLPPQMGRFLLNRDNLVVLEQMRATGAAMRENFRMPVDFESYAYLPEGGRAAIRALDLSCGGIAMYSAHPFYLGEIVEIAIPITADGPLLVDCEILRATPFNGPIQRFAGRFVNLIDDQEAALREAVFLAQMQTVQSKPKKR